MSKNWNYASGDWNLICDVCSKKIKASEAKQRWDGFIVCKDDYEQRQPLDFIRARQDKISVPFTRPVPTDTFVPNNFTETYTDQVYQIEDAFDRIVTYIRELSDSVTFSDEITSYGYGEGLTDTISFSDVLTSVLVTLLDLADTTSLTDAIVSAVDKILTDSVTASDTLAVSFSKELTDSLTTTDALQYTLNAALTDSTAVTDALTSITVSSTLADTITVSDTLVSQLIPSSVINGSVINNQVIN